MSTNPFSGPYPITTTNVTAAIIVKPHQFNGKGLMPLSTLIQQSTTIGTVHTRRNPDEAPIAVLQPNLLRSPSMYRCQMSDPNKAPLALNIRIIAHHFQLVTATINAPRVTRPSTSEVLLIQIHLEP